MVYEIHEKGKGGYFFLVLITKKLKGDFLMQKKIIFFMTICCLSISLLIGGCNSMENKPAATKTFPVKPITIIVPFSAGGGLDMVARSLEKVGPKYIGQPFVVVNKPGASGTIGWNELAGSNPDGYTLGITAVELIVQPLYGPTKYHYPTALEPLVQASTSSFIMVVDAKESWKNLAEFIAYSKEHPGELKFGNGGIGSAGHIIGEAFASTASISLVQVPFRGSSEVTTALLGKHIEIAFISPASVKEHIKNGTLRALAVSSEQRLTDPDLAYIPTFKEQGLDIIGNNPIGVAAPKGLPKEVKSELEATFKAIISDPEFKNSMNQLGMQAEYLDSKKTEAQWLEDNKKLSKIITETGILERIKEQKK